MRCCNRRTGRKGSARPGILAVRAYTPVVERDTRGGADGIRDYEVWSCRTRQGSLERGLRFPYAHPLKASPCRIGAGFLAGPAGIARIAAAMFGPIWQCPSVAAFFFIQDGSLVSVSTEDSWFDESCLLKPDCLYQRAADRSASSVAIASSMGWEMEPEPTFQQVKQTADLFGEGMGVRRIHLLDCVILNDTLRGPVIPFFSFLAHGCLPSFIDGQYEWRERDWPSQAVATPPTELGNP